MESAPEIFSGRMLMLAAIYTLVFVIVLLDLWSGIRKARARNEFRSSYGLRRTVEKLATYFNMMLVLTVIDMVQMLGISHLNPQISFTIPVIPLLTFLGAIFVGIIEFKSIYEKAEAKDKGKYQHAAKIARQIISDTDSRALIAKVMEYLSTENTKKDETDC